MSSGVVQFLSNNNANNYNTSRPKAYVNWISFDEQFKMVEGNSGAIQIPSIAAGAQKQAIAAPQQVIRKNGYLYVYLSNESSQNVFFDQLVIHHKSGPLLEETHYYPFGLTMSGISSTAPLKLENRFKYNGNELNHKEFNDGSGLEQYDFGTRLYDPQLGRWNVIDPASELAHTWSPYRYDFDNPILYSDILGLWEITANGWYTNNSLDIERFTAMLQIEESLYGQASTAEVDKFISEEFNGQGGRLSNGSILLTPR